MKEVNRLDHYLAAEHALERDDLVQLLLHHLTFLRNGLLFRSTLCLCGRRGVAPLGTRRHRFLFGRLTS